MKRSESKYLHLWIFMHFFISLKPDKNISEILLMSHFEIFTSILFLTLAFEMETVERWRESTLICENVTNRR